MSPSPSPPLEIAARVRRWRLATGVSIERLGARPPLGVRVTADLSAPIEEGDAVLVLPSSQLDSGLPAAIAEVLPEPRGIAGALVVVAPVAPLSGFFARLSLRRAEPIARSVRGAALFLRGYRRIGGGVDPESGLDLVWGE